MGSVVQLKRRRTAAPKPRAKNAREDEESRRSLMVLVGTFTFAAVAMSAAVVIAGSNSWAEAAPLIACVIFFALAKVLLADMAFFGLLRADRASEAAALERKKVSGSVMRRPVANPAGRVAAVSAPIIARPKPGRPRLAVVRNGPNRRCTDR
jgi:hypothetical protein